MLAKMDVKNKIQTTQKRLKQAAKGILTGRELKNVAW